MRAVSPSGMLFACLFRLSIHRAARSAPPLEIPVSWSSVVPPCFRSLMVGKKLYVGNLTYRMNSSDLEQLFSQYGSVRARR